MAIPRLRIIAVLVSLVLLTSGLSFVAPLATAPEAAAAPTFEQEVLRLINKARSTKRKCGSTTYAAAKALKRNAKLAKAAESHSRDMSARNYFSHTNTKGQSPYARIKAAGYKYKAAGETLAAGYSTPSSVVNAWLKSTGHCKILMSKSYTQVGIGFYSGGGKYRNYTTADFGKPA